MSKILQECSFFNLVSKFTKTISWLHFIFIQKQRVMPRLVITVVSKIYIELYLMIISSFFPDQTRIVSNKNLTLLLKQCKYHRKKVSYWKIQ